MINRGMALNQLEATLRQNKLAVERKTWKNFTGNLTQESAVIVDVSSVEEAVMLMKHIMAANIQLQRASQPIISVTGVAGWKDQSSRKGYRWTHSDTAWEKEQRRTYNESFSVSAQPGQVIVRFNPDFQKQNYYTTENIVACPAGMQIGDIDLRLANMEQPRSLVGTSMIAKTTAVGLAGNGGYGADGTLTKQIKAIRTIDDRGCIRVIRPGEIETHFTDDATGKITSTTKEKFEHFDTIAAAHLGAFGLIINIEFETVPKFRLKEQRYTYPSLEALQGDITLREHLAMNQNFTLKYMPVSDKDALKFDVRVWNKTNEPDQMPEPHYIAGNKAREMELTIRANDWINDCIYDHALTGLLPSILNIGSKVAIGTKEHTRKNPAVIVGDQHEVKHKEATAFPGELIDINLNFAVPKEQAAEVLEWLLKNTQEVLGLDELKGQTPITYAMYARCFKGDDRGLSPTRTKQGEVILAFEWTTHPNAPGLDIFLKHMFSRINAYCAQPNSPCKAPMFHHGKFISARRGFQDYCGKEALDKFKAAREAFCGGKVAAENSAFYTDYLRDMCTRRAGSVLPENLKSIQESIQRYQKPSRRQSNRTDEEFLSGLDEFPELKNVAGKIRE